MGIGCDSEKWLAVVLFGEVGGGPKNIVFGEFVSVVGGGGRRRGDAEEAIHGCRISEPFEKEKRKWRGQRCVFSGWAQIVGISGSGAHWVVFKVMTRPMVIFVGNPRGWI